MVSCLVIVAICLSPVHALAGSCLCGNSSSELSSTVCCSVDTQAKSCCSADQKVSSCCVSKPATIAACHCNPSTESCQCETCECADSSDTPSSPPAAPPTESHETQTFVTFSFISWVHTQTTMFPADSGSTSLRMVTLSSQQTCVLLSRFTC